MATVLHGIYGFFGYQMKYNWSGASLRQGGVYSFSVAAGDTWEDDDITCGPGDWTSAQLPWY